MARRELVFGGIAVACCALVAWSCVGDDPGGQPPPDVDSGGADAPVTSDAQTADETPTPPVDAAVPDSGCNSTMPFLTVASLGNAVNTASEETAPRLTPDELVLYYTQLDVTNRLYTRRVSRISTTSPWTGKTTFYDTTVERVHVWTSNGERRVYYGQRDLTKTPVRWQLVRATLDAGVVDFAFTADDLNGPSPTFDLAPYAAADESEIWWESNRGSGNVDLYDIYSAPALPDGGGFGAPQAATALNSAASELAPVLSADKLTIYFASARGRMTGTSIWMSTRLKPTDAFNPPVLAPGLAPLEDESASIHGSAVPGWISPDGCRLYVSTTKDIGTSDLYVASRR